MSHKTDMARLEFILKIIDDIELIIDRHDGISNALSDIEGYHAIMMCCFQIGESIAKISTLEIAEKLHVKAATGMRNVIAHNYLGVRSDIIEQTIREDLPILKKTLLQFKK